MAGTIRSIVPGDYPTLESLYDLPSQLADLYPQLAGRVLELDDLRLSELEQIQSAIHSLENQIGELETRYEQIATGFRRESSGRQVWVERFDSDLGTEQSTLYRDPRGAYLSLKFKEMVSNLKAFKSFRILKTRSYGIPGNNMEIAAINMSSRDGFRYAEVFIVGEKDRRANIAAVFDGSPETLFEWEVNVVPPVQQLEYVDGIQLMPSVKGKSVDIKKATENFGWQIITVYPEQERVDPGQREDIAVFRDNPPKPAEIVFEMELQPDTTGILDIVTTASGGLLPNVFLLQGSRDGLDWQNLLRPPGRERWSVQLSESERMDTKITVQVDGFRWLRIGLRSGGYYRPGGGLAHPCAVAIIDERFEQSALWGAIERSEDRVLKWRVETEAFVVGSVRMTNVNAMLAAAIPVSLALTAAGVTMGWLTSIVGSGAVAWLGPAAPVVGFVLGVVAASGIYRETKTRALRAIITGYDVFIGFRSAVAIREFQLLRASYEPEGEWVSRPIRFREPVRRILLHAEQSVPEGGSVEYYLSTDQSNWIQIEPVQTGGEPVVLDRSSDLMYLRIAMRSQRSVATPIVYSVGLEAWE